MSRKILRQFVFGRKKGRKYSRYVPRRWTAEMLEVRVMPAVLWDGVLGILTVTGDEGVVVTNDRIDVGVDGDGFVRVRINGDVHSGNPAASSSQFDPIIGGVQGTAVNEILVQGVGGNDNLRVREGFTNADGDITIEGGSGDDRLMGSSLADELDGGTGNDLLKGGSGNDALDGGDGNDRLQGQNGNDDLFGGANDDTLQGHNGDDELFGDTGNDVLQGHNDNDSLSGGDGDDVLQGHNGNDSLDGGNGNDSLLGHNGDDTAMGGNNNDMLLGHGGNDSLNGENGLDLLNGSGGDDTLRGGSENDSLIGGGGFDFASGDNGVDAVASAVEVDTSATLAGAAGSGTLDFEISGGEIEALLDISGLTPNSIFDIEVDGRIVGEIDTDGSGDHTSQVSNTPNEVGEEPFPANFPEVLAGEIVRIRNSTTGAIVLEGTFVETVV